MQQFNVGQPVIFSGAVGYILAVEDNDGGGASHTIGAGGMQEIKHRISIVFTGDNPHVSRDVAEQQAETWAARAAHLPSVAPDTLPDLVEVAELHQQEQQLAAQNARTEKDKERADFVAKYADKVPGWAKSVIIAHRHVDESDPMSDYAGYRVGESIILAFSKHERNLFPELRKAAANAPETEHLATKPACPEGREEFWTPEDEHRENYSMGGGTYLGVYRNSDGWTVKKHTMYSNDESLMTRIPTGRWAVPEGKPKAASTTATTAAGAHVEEHYHTKRQQTVHIVVPEQRVERPEYIRLLAEAKALGGWYCRAWKGTPGGYAFKDSETAERFLSEQYDCARVIPPTANDPEAVAAQKRAVSSCQAEKFKTLADTMQLKIDEKLADRLENTPKRQAQAASARLEGRRLERTQAALRALAALHEAGECPEILAGLRNRAAIYEHMGSKLQSIPNGFHEYKVETGEPNSEDPVAVALWALLDAPDPEKVKADELAQKIRNLRGAKIPGYYPTPDAVIDEMLEHACLEPYHHVLEPEAGSGAIVDRVAGVLGEDGILCVHETQHSLCEILQAKGYDARPGDFLERKPGAMKFDRVLMNPPFEKLQDIDHVTHAYKFLKPGGVLVAVMSPSPFSSSFTKAEGFRDWFRIVGGAKYDLPEGSFKASGTGVASVLVVIESDPT